jgi:hypothetical protein
MKHRDVHIKFVKDQNGVCCNAMIDCREGKEQGFLSWRAWV